MKQKTNRKIYFCKHFKTLEGMDTSVSFSQCLQSSEKRKQDSFQGSNKKNNTYIRNNEWNTLGPMTQSFSLQIYDVITMISVKLPQYNDYG